MKPDIGIPANEPFTSAETDAVKFVYEILTTNNKTVQTYLESIPQFDGWWNKEEWEKKNEGKEWQGHSDEKPLYTLLDRESEAKITNEDTRRRAKAVLKILEIEDLKEIQDLMIRLNGSFFTPPDNVLDCQNLLVEFVDDADDAMLDKLLKDEETIDEKVTILIGRAINEKIISFDALPNQVAKKKGTGWAPVKEISSEHPLDERKRYFAEFLTSSDGKLLLSDLEKEVNKTGEETKTKKLKKT